MNFNEKLIWKIITIMGAVFMGFCFSTSIIQFFLDKSSSPFIVIAYSSLIINTVVFMCFLYMVFAPINFYLYAFVCYFYGLGNYLDGGNSLGTVCIITAMIFLIEQDFFAKKKAFKYSIFILIPLLAFLSQLLTQKKLYVAISFFHITGTIFMAFMIFIMLYPKLLEIKEHKTIRILDPEEFTPGDLLWIKQIQTGKTYSQLALETNTSESKIKNTMREIYKKLNVKDRTEFNIIYKNYEFKFSEN